MPQFQICINYRLSCFFDDRVRLAKLAAAPFREVNPSSYKTYKELDDKQQDLGASSTSHSRLACGVEAGSKPSTTPTGIPRASCAGPGTTPIESHRQYRRSTAFLSEPRPP
jgi:hypothetical protein